MHIQGGAHVNTLMWLEKSVDKQDITINQLATFASSKTKYGVYGVYGVLLAGVGRSRWVLPFAMFVARRSRVGLLVLCCVGLGA